MSRKGVITKRVKTGPDGSIEKPRQAVQSWPRNECSAVGQNQSVRLKSRPKFKPSGRVRITTREACPAVGQATPLKPCRARPKPREPGSKPCGRAPNSRTTADGIRPSREATSRVRPRKHRPIFTRPTTAADRESGHDRSDPTTTTPDSGRPSRPTVRTPRSTRSPF
ncbi:unnamed protein product [Microthlaspi erraticum]|uniref:Uncharacterized protein n=1 Tax=Microthlaspi erraticum TaxID=1685480 RepID=A0A6D2KLN8_9BRAS|nr:unnamed protein product [Microthlaspi erraticum]